MCPLFPSFPIMKIGKITPHEVNVTHRRRSPCLCWGVKREFMQSLTTRPSIHATQEIVREKRKEKKKRPQLHPKGRTKRLCEENGVYTRSTFSTRYNFAKTRIKADNKQCGFRREGGNIKRISKGLWQTQHEQNTNAMKTK